MGFFIFGKCAFYSLKLHLQVCLIGGLSQIKILSTYLVVSQNIETKKNLQN